MTTITRSKAYLQGFYDKTAGEPEVCPYALPNLIEAWTAGFRTNETFAQVANRAYSKPETI